MRWSIGRDRTPEDPPPDEWTLEKRQKANLISLYQCDIQRAVTAWEAYQEDQGRYGKDTPHGH